MTEHNPDLTISIVTGGDTDCTMACLKSLIDSLDQTVSVEIYLVDNLSADRTGKIATQQFPFINCIYNRQMQGFAANHNQVLTRAKGRYVLILNDDTVVNPGFVQALISAADRLPAAGVFGPRTLNTDGSLQITAYKFPSPWRDLLHLLALPRFFPDHNLIGDYRNWSHDREREVDFVIGAALMIRQDVIEQIGGLDELFYMYCEDADWCLRAQKRGWKVMLIPDAVMTHLGGHSSHALPAAQRAEFIRSHGKYMRKHYGASGLLMHRILIGTKHALRLLYSHTTRSSEQERKIHSDRILWSLGLLKSDGLAQAAAKINQSLSTQDQSTKPVPDQ